MDTLSQVLFKEGKYCMMDHSKRKEGDLYYGPKKLTLEGQVIIKNHIWINKVSIPQKFASHA